MKILFLADSFPPETNAAADRVFERAALWAHWGHDVTVLTSAPNFPEGRLYPGYANRWHQIEHLEGIRVVRVKTFITAGKGTVRRTLDFLSFMITAVIAGLFERRPDVVAATSPPFFAAVGGWILGMLRRTPFVFELEDSWPASGIGGDAKGENRRLAMMERAKRSLYRRSDCIVAPTEALKGNLTNRGIDPAKITVVRDGAVESLKDEGTTGDTLAEHGRRAAARPPRQRQAVAMLQALEIAAAGWGGRIEEGRRPAQPSVPDGGAVRPNDR